LSQDWLNPADRDKFLSFLLERFGIPKERFADFELFVRGEYMFALSKPAAEASRDYDCPELGLQIAKLTHSGHHKPTSRGMQVFGDAATKNVVEIDAAGIKSLVEGRRLDAPGSQGFVILRHRGLPIGVGLCREGRLESQFPRSMTEHLALFA
jgi:NOL1/NOP2/fmu family ribosome biogenesis protein